MCFTSETHYHNSIYTIGCADNFIDDEGKYVHFLHLFANDDLQPLPDGARAFPTVIIAGKVSRSTFSVEQENGLDMDVSQYVAGTQQDMLDRCYYPCVLLKLPCLLPASTSSFRALQSITGYHCIVTVKDIALGPSDTLITTDDSSSSILI